ncbi:MAG: hypothetical protein LBP28_05645 [Coriobacteriales bacterium]|jgi:hypothetical protein|nr:hypothetical protein [Coriobacteriales bacterium]
MKAVFIDNDIFGLKNGSEYEVLARDDLGSYRIVNAYGESYLHSTDAFRLLDGSDEALQTDDEYWQSVRDSERVRTFLRDIEPGMPMDEFQDLTVKANLSEDEYLVCWDYVRQ